MISSSSSSIIYMVRAVALSICDTSSTIDSWHSHNLMLVALVLVAVIPLL
jgi:hypothetical protein